MPRVAGSRPSDIRTTWVDPPLPPSFVERLDLSLYFP